MEGDKVYGRFRVALSILGAIVPVLYLAQTSNWVGHLISDNPLGVLLLALLGGGATYFSFPVIFLLWALCLVVALNMLGETQNSRPKEIAAYGLSGLLLIVFLIVLVMFLGAAFGSGGGYLCYPRGPCMD